MSTAPTLHLQPAFYRAQLHLYRYYRTTTHLVSRQIYFHPGEQNWGTEAKGRVLSQEPASCRPRWTSWCCVLALSSNHSQPTCVWLLRSRGKRRPVNSSVLISQCWPHRWVRGHAYFRFHQAGSKANLTCLPMCLLSHLFQAEIKQSEMK